jgi:hypothetical protein
MGLSSKIGALWGGRPRLGTMLVREGLITREQLAVALEEQQRKGSRLGYQLVKLGMVPEDALGHFLAEKFHVPTLDEDSLHLPPATPEAAETSGGRNLLPSAARKAKLERSALGLWQSCPARVGHAGPTAVPWRRAGPQTGQGWNVPGP